MGLMLTRKIGQSLIVNDDLEIMITQIKGSIVRVAVFGDPEKYRVLRSERFTDQEFRQKIEANRKRHDPKD